MNVFTITRISATGYRMPALKLAFRRLALLAALLLMAAPGILAQNVSVTVRANGQTLADVLPEITKQTGMEFSYNVDLLKTKLSTKEENIRGSVGSVLDKLLAGTGIEYIVSGNRIFLARESEPQLPVAAQPAAGQPQQYQYRLTGTVNAGDGSPLGGVMVMEGASNVVVTGENGDFAITVKPDSELSFTYLGYETVTEPVSGRAVLNVVMQETATEMDDVVVVGYRTVRKVSLIGSVATINMADKEKQAIATTAQVLYSTPGIFVNQGSAKPGREGTTIRIQGINSLNSAAQAPLVLLDGVKYDMAEIDPNSIESISILKDVSAAIYGNDSTNGVILITSKRGVKGKPRIEFKGMFGIQAPTILPDVITDPILYMKLRNQAEINSGTNPEAVNYTPAQIAEYEAGMSVDPTVYPASDWYDICLKNGIIQQYSVRLSGGGDAVTYSMGLGYTDQTGIFIANDDAQRYAFDLKLNARVGKKLNVSGTFQGNLRKLNEVGYGSPTVMGVIARALPIFSDYHKNGLYGSTWLFTPGRNSIENPRMEVEQGSTFRDYQEYLATVSFDWSIANSLKYYATGSIRKNDHFSKDAIPSMFTVNPKTGETKAFNTSVPRIKEWDSTYQQLMFSHRLVWEKLFAGKHDIHVMVGNEYKDYVSRNFQAYNFGFNDNTLTEFGALTNQTNAQATGGSSFSREISVFGRAAYTFAEKYFAEITMRYDGSSRLAPGHRWAFFPSAMIGWRIDNEDFFNASGIELLKIRASVGALGSQSVGNYAYQMTYDAIGQNYSFGGERASGYAITALTDETLTWERTVSYNVGLDLMALRSRLSFEGNLFYKRTSDIIMEMSIPSHIGGLDGPDSNVGTVANKGFEVIASWRDRVRNFTYGVNGSVSFFRNKVVSMNVDQIYANGYRNITKVGYPINSFYLYKAEGYYQSQADIDDTPVVYGTRQDLRPGYVKYANTNNDNIINEEDKIITGNTIPEMMYSFGINLGWKDIALDAQFQGVGNVYVYPTGNIAYPFNNGAGVTADWNTESWTENNPNSKLPLLTIATQASENFIESTQWLHNTKYLRLKNIQLTYSFPKRLIQKARIERLQVFVSAQNLLTFSPFKLWDPEIATNAVNLNQYPNMKTVTVGVALDF